MNTQAKHTLHKLDELPFLKAVCWDLHDVSLLSQDEILSRYERGWIYKGVLADLSPQEMNYVIHLAKAKGSWLQTRV